jgi:hypothetical protein
LKAKTKNASKEASVIFMNDQILQSEIEEFNDYLSSVNDDRYEVLLVHLYIENIFDKYIDLKLEDPTHVTSSKKFGFAQKFALVLAFGKIDDQLRDGISKINKLRNKLAHDYKYEISESDVNEMGRTLGSKFNDIKSAGGNLISNILASITAKLAGLVLAENVNINSQSRR